MKEIKDNRYCSMIEDLLPLYVEGLISEETKCEIEMHLKNCDKCSKVLEEIRKDDGFDLEKQLNENSEEMKAKEIKCIKNIKRRTTLKIIISIIITCVIFAIGIKLWNTYRFIQDEDGKWILYNFDTGNIEQGMNYTHLLMEYTDYKIRIGEDIEKNTEGSRERIEYSVILTFNKENICVNARQIINGYSEEELQEVYENYVNNWKHSNPNVKIQDGKLYMDENVYIGKSKDKIIKIAEDHNAKLIEY